MESHEGMIPLFQSKLQFQVGRAVHMSTSCVECGLCEEACPQDVNLTRLFILLAEANWKLFNYKAGRSMEEPPLRTFIPEELSGHSGIISEPCRLTEMIEYEVYEPDYSMEKTFYGGGSMIKACNVELSSKVSTIRVIQLAREV